MTMLSCLNKSETFTVFWGLARLCLPKPVVFQVAISMSPQSLTASIQHRSAQGGAAAPTALLCGGIQNGIGAGQMPVTDLCHADILRAA